MKFACSTIFAARSKSISLFVGGFLAVFGLVGTASSDIVTLRIDSTISLMHSNTISELSAVGVGDPIRVEYMLDTDTLVSSTATRSDYTNPVVGIQLSIGGVTYTWTTDLVSQAIVLDEYIHSSGTKFDQHYVSTDSETVNSKGWELQRTAHSISQREDDFDPISSPEYLTTQSLRLEDAPDLSYATVAVIDVSIIVPVSGFDPNSFNTRNLVNRVSILSVPEPSTVAIFFIGLLGVGFAANKKRKA